jgi:excisionase family DNA binding protein
MPSDLPDFLTMRQTADELRCHPDTVAALIRRGELKAVRIGRAVRVLSSSLQQLPAHGPDADALDLAHGVTSIPMVDACSNVIRAISEEMDREAKFAFLNKRHANYHQAEVLRQKAAMSFARINGWTLTEEMFCPAELGGRGHVLDDVAWGDPKFFDHAIAFTKRGVNVAVVGQPYSCSASADAFRSYAAENGLEAHVPPNCHASFWYPPHTLFLVLTSPGEVVRWLPEQRESAL